MATGERQMARHIFNVTSCPSGVLQVKTVVRPLHWALRWQVPPLSGSFSPHRPAASVAALNVALIWPDLNLLAPNLVRLSPL